MKQKEFEKRIKKIKKQEKKYDCIIEFDETYCRDKDHLDCIFYGGEVGCIKYHNYIITIEAIGDVEINGLINGEEFYCRDRQNSGNIYYELGNIIDDKKLEELSSYETSDQNNYINYENNNWFEFNLITPNGDWIDMCGYDNILSDNILDCFEDIEWCLECVKMIERG